MLRNICILLLVAVLCTVTYAKKVYPWGGGDVNERSEDILEALRKNLRLETFQDSISKVFKVDGNNNLHMKNDEGVSFVAKLKTEIITDAKEVISEVGQVVYDVNTLDAQLRSSCAVMSIDYWNYEWCHRYGEHHIRTIELIKLYTQETCQSISLGAAGKWLCQGTGVESGQVQPLCLYPRERCRHSQ
jgi:hypothetical protein